jgi:ArsR family transcriptional regulator
MPDPNNPDVNGLLLGLSASADATRLRLLALLAQAELTVTELTTILEQSQPRISRHLKLMVDAGLLDRFREGAYVFYRLALEGWNAALARDIAGLLPKEDAQLKRDNTKLHAIQQERHAWAADYFAANAPHWDQLRSLYVNEEKVEAALVKLLPQKINRLLDIGTGTGRMLELFANRATQLIGVDNSPSMLDIARLNLSKVGITNTTLHRADMYHLPWHGPIFDVVTLHRVLHFAHEPQHVITEISKVLATDGRLVIVDFAPHTLEELRTEHGHRRLGFSDKEITHWCKQANLTLEKVDTLTGKQLNVCLWLIRPANPPRKKSTQGIS